MIIKKNQSILEVDKVGAKIFDYPLESQDVGFSYQELDGRVPQSGSGKNTECDEWYFVIEGSGIVTIDNSSEAIEAGDLVCIQKGESSFLVANKMRLVTVTKPNWNVGQYEENS